jgi:hypothetical protein
MKSNEMLNLYLQKKVNEKENLSSQKVELSNLKTLVSETKKVDAILKEGDKAQQRFDKLRKDANILSKEFLAFSNDYKQGLSLPVNLYGTIKDVIAKGKELGIDLSTNQDVKFAELIMKSWEESRKEVMDLSKKAEAISKNII